MAGMGMLDIEAPSSSPIRSSSTSTHWRSLVWSPFVPPWRSSLCRTFLKREAAVAATPWASWVARYALSSAPAAEPGSRENKGKIVKRGLPICPLFCRLQPLSQPLHFICGFPLHQALMTQLRSQCRDHPLQIRDLCLILPTLLNSLRLNLHHTFHRLLNMRIWDLRMGW